MIGSAAQPGPRFTMRRRATRWVRCQRRDANPGVRASSRLRALFLRRVGMFLLGLLGLGRAVDLAILAVLGLPRGNPPARVVALAGRFLGQCVAGALGLGRL